MTNAQRNLKAQATMTGRSAAVPDRSMPPIFEHVGEYPCSCTSDVAAHPSSVADLLRRVDETGALRTAEKTHLLLPFRRGEGRDERSLRSLQACHETPRNNWTPHPSSLSPSEGERESAAPETGVLRRRVRRAWRRRESAMLSTDLIIGMAILVVAIMPLAFSFAQEGKLFRQSYQKAAAMELIDGEMEILVAGEWRNFHEGSSPYELHGSSTRNLPPGRTLLTINGKNIRLEWLPEKENAATKVVREGVGK
jgi:hypothetical protein